MGALNGEVHAPSTPDRTASSNSSATTSGTNSESRRPATLKKRRPSSDASIGGMGVNTSAGAGPSPLRREVEKVDDKNDKAAAARANGDDYLNPRSTQIQKLLVKWEVPRKALHSSIGFVVIYLYISHQDVYTIVKLLFRALVVITTFDLLRFASRRIERTYERLLGFLMRESEKTTWNGVIWYLVGVIFVLTTLPRDLATLSVMILSWADTAASVIGRKYGKYTPKLPSPPFAKRKSLAGTTGAFIFGALSAHVFFKYAAPWGSENDLTWLGESYSYVPDVIKRVFASQGKHLQRWTGPITSFPDYLSIGQGARISTKLPAPRSTLPLWQVELICAFSAAIAEGIDIYGLDDNVIMPVLSGLMIWASLFLLQ